MMKEDNNSKEKGTGPEQSNYRACPGPESEDDGFVARERDKY